MERLRQSPVGKRVAIVVIALYALLLQGFLAAAVPAMAFAPSDGITCTQNESGAPLPAGKHHPHGFCCILACAACGSAYVAAVAGTGVFPAPETSALVFAPLPRIGAPAPRKLYFSARGPPQAL
jgi:hypothetical protein